MSRESDIPPTLPAGGLRDGPNAAFSGSSG